MHFFNASMYTPWSVFLDPQVTRTVSGNQLAPWNLFIYQVNYALFGLEPLPYYLHHLLSLVGAAGGLYVLLRHWLGPRQSLLPAAMLLIGAPSVHMAQQLMVGHYLDGMLFACLGLWAYIHAVQKARWSWALLAAAFYLLSALCKEVYVPWIALMLLLPLPAGSPSGMARWRFALPALAIALAYAVIRVSVFSGMGGYHGQAVQHWGALPGFFGNLTDELVDGLLGDGALGIAAAVLCVACAAAGVAAQPRKDRPGMLIGLGAVLVVVIFPMMFVAHSGVEWMAYARYLWVPWAALCVLWSLKWPPALTHWRKVALLVVMAAAAQQSWAQREYDRPLNAMFDAYYDFVLNPPPDQSLVFTEFTSPVYLTSMVMSAHAAWQRLEPGKARAAPALLRNAPSNAAERSRVRVWDEECRCLAPLDSLPPTQQEAALRPQLASIGYAVLIDAIPARIALGYGGAIDAMTVQGNKLHVSGWTPTIGSGRKLLLAAAWHRPGSQVSMDALASVERPDVVQAYGQPDMLMSGFEATLGFSDEQAAQAARASLCAMVLSHLPGQEHQYLLLPVQGQPRCANALAPSPTRAVALPSNQAH